jgi:3-hydroxypropanoate dehydrogenase
MSEPRSRLQPAALDQLFRQARTRNAWRPEPVDEGVWRELYELASLGPTAANCSPARLLFLVSEEGKARALKHLSKTNAAKSGAASAIVIIAQDLNFADHLPKLNPRAPGAQNWYSDPAVRDATALRNSALQGAYLILAARALGLDAGPISGFDANGIDEEFFAGTSLRANFICMLGYGADEPLPRLPRLAFDEACQIT